WQGGAPRVPYDLIQDEYERNEYTIVKKEALPDGLEYLIDPMIMSESQVDSMIAHIGAGDNNELSPERVFQFNQWAPGKYSHGEHESPDWYPTIIYSADTLSLVKGMDRVRGESVHVTLETLPSIPISQVPYKSFSNVAIATYQQLLLSDDLWWGLQTALSEHDE
ncbi:hypothetical protein FRC11_001268, partial [Ceratobasidium sp. 423]